MNKIMIIFGTRPEAIKMCPLVNELKQRDFAEVLVCVTGQHREMLDQVLSVFHVKPDYDLAVMKPRQTLFDITINILNGVRSVLEQEKYDLRCRTGMFLPPDTGWTCRGGTAHVQYIFALPGRIQQRSRQHYQPI